MPLGLCRCDSRQPGCSLEPFEDLARLGQSGGFASLEQGDRIELRGFGVFTVKPRKTGIGRNPRTGAEVSIPPGKAVRFKPGKELQTLQ